MTINELRKQEWNRKTQAGAFIVSTAVLLDLETYETMVFSTVGNNGETINDEVASVRTTSLEAAQKAHAKFCREYRRI